MDRRTDRHTHRNTSHPSRRRSENIEVTECKHPQNTVSIILYDDESLSTSCGVLRRYVPQQRVFPGVPAVSHGAGKLSTLSTAVIYSHLCTRQLNRVNIGCFSAHLSSRAVQAVVALHTDSVRRLTLLRFVHTVLLTGRSI